MSDDTKTGTNICSDSCSTHADLGFQGSEGTKYEEIVGFLDLSKEEVSKLASVEEGSIRFDDQIPEQVRVCLDEILDIIKLAADFFKDKAQLERWFKTRNTMIHKRFPRDLIIQGRNQELVQFILEIKKYDNQNQSNQ